MIEWEITNGADLYREIQFVDVQKNVFDLTGHTVTCDLRTAPNGRRLASATVNVTAATDGEINVNVTAAALLASPDTTFLDFLVKRTSDSHKIFSEKIMLVKEGGITRDV